MEGFSLSPAGCKLENFDFSLLSRRGEMEVLFNLSWLLLWHYE